MARKALIEKSHKPQRYKTRAYNRCNRCGRARATYRSSVSVESACGTSPTRASSRA